MGARRLPAVYLGRSGGRGATSHVAANQAERWDRLRVVQAPLVTTTRTRVRRCFLYLGNKRLTALLVRIPLTILAGTHGHHAFPDV